MALTPAHATVYAVKSQGYRVKGWINDATTGNGMDLSAGGTTLSATISKDDGAAVSTTNTPQKVTGQAGRFYLDLEAAEMAYSNVGVVVSCNLANQMEAKIDILILDLSEVTGRADAQAIVKFEQVLKDHVDTMQNKEIIDTAAGTSTRFKADSSTTKTTATVSKVGATLTRGKHT